MTAMFAIGSQVVPMFPILVQGVGDNTLTAKSSALTIARTLRGIEKPVVLTERQRAEAIRRWAATEQVRLVRIPPPNGRYVPMAPWWMTEKSSPYKKH